jgi:hypothetical protein
MQTNNIHEYLLEVFKFLSREKYLVVIVGFRGNGARILLHVRHTNRYCMNYPSTAAMSLGRN